MTTLAASAPQEAEVLSALASIKRPKGLEIKDVIFKEDYSGDPAVYVVITVSKRLGVGSNVIRKLGILRDHVFKVLDDLQLGRMLYVRYIDAK